MISASAHIPVMTGKVTEALNIQHGGRYIDCTVGAGGHAAAILEQSSPGGQLLGIDADPEAAEAARQKLAGYGNSVLIVNDSFFNLEAICLKNDFTPVHGILFDLGLSSMQLEEGGRGFSFQHEAPLDMRFSPDQKLTAADIINKYSEAELARIIREYGEESFSQRIARNIISRRPINTTLELAKVVEQAVGGRKGKIHPATRTFQALRIAVNHELEHLESALRQAVSLLGFEGRLAVISYHSLEDRIVKQFFRREAADCICPPQAMKCTCNHSARLKLISKKVITPSEEEIKRNPRSRSAKMRVVERIVTQQEWRETAERLCFLGEADATAWRKPALLKKMRAVSIAN